MIKTFAKIERPRSLSQKVESQIQEAIQQKNLSCW
jgi:hypothetical protein